MPGKVIGKTLNHGFAGSFARTPDMIIKTKIAETDVKFGRPVLNGTGNDQVKDADATLTATNFAGVVVREVKSALDYVNQNEGKYLIKDAIPVIQRGSVNVICANGTPKAGDAVYVAITTSAFTGAVIGDFASTVTGTSGTDYITLSNAQWGGEKDANKIAELVLLTRANA